MFLKLVNWLFSFIPRSLPTGMSEFDSWVYDIVRVSGLPDNDSTRRVAAQFLMFVGRTKAHLSIRAIAIELRKAAALQIANQVIKDTEPKATVTTLKAVQSDDSEAIPDPKSPVVS